ncbi:MAG: DUF6375 family protein [Catenulispora sp.]
MKIWFGYGSEHSANLVMIGHFRNAGDAQAAKDLLDSLFEAVSSEISTGTSPPPDRFSEPIRRLLMQERIYSLRPEELENFTYDAAVSIDGDKLVLNTEEVEISGFLKVFIDRGARVEVYSADLASVPEE